MHTIHTDDYIPIQFIGQLDRVDNLAIPNSVVRVLTPTFDILLALQEIETMIDGRFNG